MKIKQGCVNRAIYIYGYQPKNTIESQFENEL